MHRPDPDVCHERTTVAEDLIHGWRLLKDEDKAWVREQVDKLDRELRP